MPRRALAVLLLAAAAFGAAPGAAAAKPRVLLAFLPTESEPGMPLLFDFAHRGLAIGLTSPTLGGYNPRQAMLDVSQGTRISTRVYPRKTPRLDVVDSPGPGARIAEWGSAVDRADDAPGDVVPGLLADTIERAGGRVSYAGVLGFEQPEAIAAANRRGEIERASLGTTGTFAARALGLWRDSDLLVALLPPDADGLAALDRLLAARRPDDLVYAMRAPPAGRLTLLPTGAAGPGLRGSLRSATTRRTGLVTGTDVAPTVLERLGLKVPDKMQGEPVKTRPGGDPQQVLDFSSRLNVVTSRRGPVLRYSLLAWLALLAALRLAAGAAGTRAAVRIGFLGVAWLPGVALVTAAIEPSQTVELLVLVLGALALAAVTELALPWPVAPALPAACVLGAHAVDLAAGSSLIVKSIAGPNPRVGARFYGIGNELETMLGLTLLLGIGAALAALRPRRLSVAFGVSAAAGAVLLGAGRLGADVGGVVTLAAGGAAAAIAARPPGRPLGRRKLALAIVAPALAVAALVALDLATAGGGHLTRSVVQANGPGDLLDIVRRRFAISVSGLGAGTTPISFGIAVALLATGVWRRRELLAPLEEAGPDAARAFRAGIVGAFFATVVGALSNDSGPVIVLIGTLGLLLAVGYARAAPRPRAAPAGTRLAA